VVTYNVLADAYAHTWGLLYPYLANEHKPPEFRLPLALADVLAADADVICLQEVDVRFFHKFWTPQLEAAGFDGRHTAKLGASGEGIALFVRRTAFEMAVFEELDLRVATGLPEEWLKEQHGLADSLERVTTVGQLALLKPAKGGFLQPLLVANAHLFYHPRAGHVRILQLHTLLRAAATLAAGEERPPAVLLCGDLNAEPQDGPIRYLASGVLSAKDAEWAAGSAFRFERALRAGPEAVASLAAVQAALPDPAEPPEVDALGFAAVPLGCGVALQHPFHLVSGCGEPPFTNYVGGFHATLDHVFVDADRLRVLGSMPPPPLEAVTVSTALPNAQFPSDHLLQCCDVGPL